MSRSTAEINQGILTDGVFYITSFLDGCFLKLFFKTIRSNQCACLEKSMDNLKCEIIQSQVTFRSIQIMLKSIPPDLRIICEDKMEFSSHKLLFGLMNTTLASIFLEDEFINEIVTLFMPTESEHLETMLNDEFLLKSQLKNITSLQCPAGSKDIDMKYTLAKFTTDIEGNYDIGLKDEAVCTLVLMLYFLHNFNVSINLG